MADLTTHYTLPIEGHDNQGHFIEIDEDGCMAVQGINDSMSHGETFGVPVAHLLTREDFLKVRHLLGK